MRILHMHSRDREADGEDAVTRAEGELLSRVRPDIAHVHSARPSLSPSVIAVLGGAGAPVVMTLHNFPLVSVDWVLAPGLPGLGSRADGTDRTARGSRWPSS
jgi:hypothetical protein